MKFQPDQMEGVNSVSRLEAGRIWVHATAFTGSLMVPWRGEVLPWDVQEPSQVRAEHFEPLLALEPELVIFGSGRQHVFISPQHYRVLIERRVGFEAMDTAAACRTYNVLANEGRKVVGAFILPVAA